MMNNNILTAKLLDLVEGRETPESWWNWWNDQEVEVERLLLFADFQSLRAQKQNFAWLPVKEAVSILEKKGISF